MIRLVSAAALLAAVASAPGLAEDAPDITGTWTGDERAHVTEQSGAGAVTFVVTEQRGADFDADVTYTSDGTSFTETISGAISPDGKSVFYAKDEGHAVGTLSGDTLDLCYIETGADAHVSCVRLTKAP